jgi:hypothetical protein
MKLIKSSLPLVWILCCAALLLAFCLQVCPAQTGTVAGLVVDSTFNAFIVGASVWLTTGEGATIGESGRFVLHDLRPRNDTLKVKAVGYRSIVCPIVIKPDSVTIVKFVLKEAILELNWELVRGVAKPPDGYNQGHFQVTYSHKLTTLRGHVLADTDDVRIAGADVLLFDQLYQVFGQRRPIARTTTNVNGEYVFRDLIPGGYVVQVESNEYQTEERIIRVDVDSDVVSDFYLSPLQHK